MPTGATRRIKRNSDGQLTNERLHCRLLQRNQMCQLILFPKKSGVVPHIEVEQTLFFSTTFSRFH